MTTLEMIAGKPWVRQIKVLNGKAYWDSTANFEVRAQLRAGKTRDSRLIANLHGAMTNTIVGDNIVTAWVLTGQQTRALYDLRWGNNKVGYVNIVYSDLGVTDAKALVVPVIQLICKDTPSKATGVT